MRTLLRTITFGAVLAAAGVIHLTAQAADPGTRVISKDGKVMTITTKGTNAKGQSFNDVEVYDKQ